MKKAALPILLLMVLSGCGAGAELTSCRSVADIFMERMSRGDHRGAYDLCDPNALSIESLRNIANKPDNAPVFDAYKGLEHGDGGQKEDKDGGAEVRLAPATPTGHPEFVVHFAFRQTDDAWRVIGFMIERK